MKLRSLAAALALSALALLPEALAELPPGAVADALAVLEAEAWEATLETTVYPESPYATPEELPATLEIETPYQSFNDYYQFALVDGKLWFKPRFKRPAGAEEWVTDLPWRPFGVRHGLPYRLDARKPSSLDTTYTDGERQSFVRDLTFRDAEADDWREYIDAEGWARSGEWPHGGEPVFDESFTLPERILALTADDDEVAVLSDERQMFYRRRWANLFVSDQWNEGWGQSKDLPVHFPRHLTDHRGWALGRITAFGTGYKTGPDGRHYEWGPAAVTMETMVWLSADGRQIYYLDSGTPPEVNHYVEAPFRGQYVGEAINSASSTIMLIDRFGAVQTKIADFDLLGSTPTHPYCYNDECDDEPFYPPGDIRSGMSDIRLPPEGWTIHGPILPPESWHEHTGITRRISILGTGKGNDARELRVVGVLAGEWGYFYKRFDDTQWRFREAPEGDKGFEGLEAELLEPEDLARYTDPEALEILHSDQPSFDVERVGQLSLGRDAHFGFKVLDFNERASPWRAEISWDGKTLPVLLHVVQAWNPYQSPHVGRQREAQTLHTYEATLSFDRVELERRIAGETATPRGMAIRTLLDSAEDRPFAFLVNATHQGLEITSKTDRKTGPFHAVALDPELSAAPDSVDIEEWSARFWGLQKYHMGWVDEAERLRDVNPGEVCTPESVRWAAEALHLEQEMDEDVGWLDEVTRTARRFSVLTFSTSGFLYLSQAKTIERLLGVRRARRDGAVRPNELRFVIIVGVTKRIPYLSANISQVQGRRRDAAQEEQKDAKKLLRRPLKVAKRLASTCE
ncbi:MAG: hypothetical protein H6740_08190 [Alphaproteobacteria bacterium]|nr:hypothetical protein [Alphaproteobacteria bacterium]